MSLSRVLCLMNDPTSRERVAMLMQAFNATVDTIGRSEEGFRSFTEGLPFDLVIVRDDLPDASAFDAVSLLRSFQHDVPVIIVADEFPDHVRRHWEAHNVTGFLTPTMADLNAVGVIVAAVFGA